MNKKTVIFSIKNNKISQFKKSLLNNNYTMLNETNWYYTYFSNSIYTYILNNHDNIDYTNIVKYTNSELKNIKNRLSIYSKGNIKT